MLSMGDAVEPKAVGGPGSGSSRPGETTVVPMGLRGGNDLREMALLHKPLWILALSQEDVHPDHLPPVNGRPPVILTREPLPPATSPTGARVVLAGAFRDTPGLAKAKVQAQHLTGTAALAIVSTGASADASLFARLLDAWDAALAFAPFPESIHAALTGPTGTPASLESLTGRLTAHGVVSGEGAITLLCADSGPEHRTLDLVAESGSLHATPAWDGSQPTRDEAILAQWRELLAQEDPGHGPSPEAMACCMACMLSLRTGQAENPRRLRTLGTDVFSSGPDYPLFA